MTSPIYLDYHATTPVDPRVVNAMLPYFTNHYGNAASRSHSFGWKADEAVEIARKQIGDLLHCNSKDLYFTSGATEGLNMLIKGLANVKSTNRNHIITVASEHHAVLDVVKWLESNGFVVSILNVSHDGSLDPELLKNQLRKETILVAAMWANNETGLIHNIPEIASICRDAHVPLICDATQAVGKIPVDVTGSAIDMLVCSAHKFYGPKGIGVVYIKSDLKPKPIPLIHGGGHEHGFRSGTLNIPAIVGMGEAARIAKAEMESALTHVKMLRDYFEEKILHSVKKVSINGNIANRLPTVSNLCVHHTDSQGVMSKFRSKLAISSGSACSSADPSPSHVLLAMGMKEDEAKASYRFSFGKPTTLEEVKQAVNLFVAAIEEYRSQSPVWSMFRSGED